MRQLIATGDVESVRILLEQGQDINAALDYTGGTPLTYSAGFGASKIVELLLARKADVNKAASGGSCALHFACMDKRTDIATILLQAGADVDAISSNETTPLLHACSMAHEPMVHLLLQHKVDVNRSRSADGLAALHVVCTNGRATLATALLNARAQVDQSDRTGGTGLHFAAFKGHLDTVRTLLQFGADHTLKATNGTAFSLAASEGHEAVQQCLRGWMAMTQEQHTCVRRFDWSYFEKPAWTRHNHHQFPEHLRFQMVALALSMHKGGHSDIVELLGLAVDCRKRGRVLDL